MKFLFLLAFTVCLGSVKAQDHSVIKTTFDNDLIRFAADILIPYKQHEPRTGLVLIQGSGTSDRSNKWSGAFAEFLANNGFFVLHPDKRGSGSSTGDWRTASFQELAGDAVAAAHHLMRGMNLEKVGIIGLSQGGKIAPITATLDTSISFVINIVGSAVPLEEQIIHEMVNTAREHRLNPDEIRQMLELHVYMKEYAFTGDWKPLKEKIEEFQSSTWSEFAKTFPSSPDSWLWKWIKLNGSFDPMIYWKNVTQPVFVGYGSKDEFDNVPVYKSVYRLQSEFRRLGKTNYEIKIYDAGHALYEDDKPQLRSDLKRDLVHWLRQIN